MYVLVYTFRLSNHRIKRTTNYSTSCVRLTKFVDCNAECGSCGNHRRPTVWSFKELEHPWHKFILVLIMTQSAVATKTPREYPILTIKNHLKATGKTLLSRQRVLQCNIFIYWEEEDDNLCKSALIK